MSTNQRTRLLIACEDRPGIIAAVSETLFSLGGNIVTADQHSESPDSGMFFMRIEFDRPSAPDGLADLAEAFRPLTVRFGMQLRLSPADHKKRLAIFVSREGHCLQELLWQIESGEIRAEVSCIISNHPTLAPVAAARNIPFYHVPVPKDGKAEAEAEAERLLAAHGVDLAVLARYMQILSPKFANAWHGRLINIHHSFLPAFVGPNPYRQAYERGVKLIGATAHYVTPELDAGPIIEQDVQRVDHRHRVADLARLGRHIERMVLARAVRWHVEDRVIIHQNRTVVFP